MTSTPRHRTKRVRDEASNSFALFIVMLPMLLGAFGMGLDMSRNVYIRTQIQNSLDLATVGGAAVTVINSNGEVAIDPENALQTVAEVYAANRDNKNLDCRNEGNVPGTHVRKCWRQLDDPTVRQSYIQYSVDERSKNAFLTVIGIKWQNYHVESQAQINQATE